MAYKRISPLPFLEGGTNVKSFTDTDGVVIKSGSQLVTVPNGTASYLFTSNGAGSAPSWQVNPGGGGTSAYNLIETQTSFLSYGLRFISGISPAFDNYLLTYSNLVLTPNASDINFSISFATGTSHIIIGNYHNNASYVATSGVGLINQLPFLGTCTLWGYVWLEGIYSNAPKIRAYGGAYYPTGTKGGVFVNSAVYGPPAPAPLAINAFYINFPSYSSATGTFSLYSMA